MTGAGLVAHIVVGLPLWLTVPVGLLGVGTLFTAIGAFTDLDMPRALLPGVVSGAVAVAAYDAVRLLVVGVFDLSVEPFEAWRFFGQGLIGAGAPDTAHWVAGAAFHVTNGLCFAVAYSLWFGRRGVVAGIAWGLFLEAFMLGLYPGWLGISAYLPFLAVSLTGHVAYGATLGLLAPRLLDRWPVMRARADREAE
jgi:hypothetical protein